MQPIERLPGASPTALTTPLATDVVTFVFTDIEGSTSRWERDRVAMQDAVRRHDAILRAAITEHGGLVFKTIGDAFCATFARPYDAVYAMVAAQQALVAEDFSAVDGLRVRVAIHSGTADAREGDYFGPAVNKVARLLAIGHGGQILLTNEAALDVSSRAEPRDEELRVRLAVTLRELGAYHLKDFVDPQRLFQLVAPGLPAEFPPLRSLGTLPSDLSILDTAQFYPVPSFSGRDDELAAVHAKLRNDGAIAVVHGLGGIGKSSIAREYGWRNREAYSVLWWLNAQTEDGIIEGLLRLGSMFVQGLDQLADRRAAAQRVINSLLGGFDKPVLLVFDNLEDEPLMRTWLPRTVRALATSRNAVWSADIESVALPMWSLETAIEYLHRASGRTDLSHADARAIAQSLGALPLALAHAAASLRNLRMLAPQRYLEHVTQHLKNAPHGAEYPRSVFATFSTAIAQAEEQAPGASAMLCFAASFAPDAIPDELFRPPIDLCPEGLRPLVSGQETLDLRSVLGNDLRLDEALGALDRLSLLAFAQSSRTYSMHRLVQLAGRDLMHDASAWTEFGVAAVQAAFPRAEFATWPQCERVLPHARAVLESLPRDAEPGSASYLARRCAIYLWARGEYDASEQLCTRALAIAQKAFGPEHPDVARALNNLAVLHMEAGRFAEAEPLLRRVLAVREKAPGSDASAAVTIHNLAIVCMELGRYAEAESLHTRALGIREKALGPNDPAILLSLTGLGVLHGMQGRHEEAESLLSRVLTVQENALGPGHPDVALSLMHVADVYADSGRGAEAEPLYLRALTILEKAHEQFGSDHPDVAEALKGLASVYRDHGRDTEAKALLVRALAIREKSLGPAHPLTKTTRDALGTLRSQK